MPFESDTSLLPCCATGFARAVLFVAPNTARKLFDEGLDYKLDAQAEHWQSHWHPI